MGTTETLIQIDTGYACAGIIVRDGRVVEAAPIFRWMLGKKWFDVVNWRNIKYWQKVETNNGKT